MGLYILNMYIHIYVCVYIYIYIYAYFIISATALSAYYYAIHKARWSDLK